MPQIDLTKEEYKALLELVYLGEWVAVATKTDGKVNKIYEKVNQLVMSFAAQAKLGKYVARDELDGSYYATAAFDGHMEEVIDEYNQDIFWEELTEQLSQRDAVFRLNGKDPDKLFELIEEEEERYSQEFERNGLLNLVLKAPEEKGKGKRKPFKSGK